MFPRLLAEVESSLYRSSDPIRDRRGDSKRLLDARRHYFEQHRITHGSKAIEDSTDGATRTFRIGDHFRLRTLLHKNQNRTTVKGSSSDATSSRGAVSSLCGYFLRLR